MDELYLKFYNLVHGKLIEVEDPNNLDQCFDLAFYWTDMLQIPREAIRHLYAYEIYTNPTDLTRQYFDIIPNDANFIPKKGDLGVFGTGVGVAGHVCICNGTGDLINFESEDQNWNGHKYCELITHTYNSFLGVLRPKAIPASTPDPVDPLSACLAQHTLLVDLCNKKDATIADLQKQLTNCQNKPPVVITKEVPSSTTIQLPISSANSTMSANSQPENNTPSNQPNLTQNPDVIYNNLSTGNNFLSGFFSSLPWFRGLFRR